MIRQESIAKIMKQGYVLCLACLLALPALGKDPPSPAKDQLSPWLTDYDEARKLARQTDRPLFVVFRCEY
jgi:hypothetical protein